MQTNLKINLIFVNILYITQPYWSTTTVLPSDTIIVPWCCHTTFFSCFHCFRSWISFRQNGHGDTFQVHMSSRAVYCPLHKIRLFVKAATLQRTSTKWHPASWNCSHGCLCSLAIAVTDHIQSSLALYGKMANNSHLFPEKKSMMKRNSRLR